MEAVSYYAIQASSDLAAERGRYSSYEGSLWSQGILPIDSLKLLKAERGDYLQVDESQSLDWDALVITSYSIHYTKLYDSVAAVYKLAEDGSKITSVSGGLTPSDATPEMRKREVAYAHSWFSNITKDIFM